MDFVDAIVGGPRPHGRGSEKLMRSHECVRHNGRVIVGLISDTHGLLREQALRALEGVDHIVHAGDVGKPEIIDALSALAPVVAVRGNIDKGAWADRLPTTAVAEVRDARIFVLHDLKQLDLDPATAGFHIVVSGHSHKPGRSESAGVLYINPGSAGPRRFKLPVTVARLDVGASPWRLDFISVEE